jgi:hypothetical protein
MDTPTLSVGNYRGVNLYVRKIGREWFEVLFPLKGQIHAYQMEINKEMGQRMRQYEDEELKRCVSLMLQIGEQLIDDRLFEIEIYNSPRERLKRLKQKVGQFIFQIKYKLSELKDKYETSKKRAGSGHSRPAELPQRQDVRIEQGSEQKVG